MFETIYMNILVYSSPLVLVAIGWAAMKLKAFIDAQVSNATLNGIMNRLNSTVETAVKAVFQQFVEPIKAGGQLTDEQKALAKKMAIEEIKSHLGQKGLNEVMYILGWKDNVEQNLGTKVEAAVADLKKE